MKLIEKIFNGIAAELLKAAYEGKNESYPLVQPIEFKLYRDQARSVQECFFPYLGMLCESKIRDAGHDVDHLLNCRAVQSLYLQVKRQFDKKLLTEANIFHFKFAYAEGLAFYNLLMNLPIKADQIWFINLRNHICNTVHKQLSKP
jgi:hypothetical protein